MIVIHFNTGNDWKGVTQTYEGVKLWIVVLNIPLRIHGTGIFTCIWLIFMVNVGAVNIPYISIHGSCMYGHF